MADTSNTNQYKYLDYAGLKTFANLVNQKVNDSITVLSKSIADTYLKKSDAPVKTLTVMYTDDKNQIRTETYNGTKAATMDLRGGLYYATTSTTATRVSNSLNFLGASDVAIDQLSSNPAESYNGSRITNLDFSKLARKATTLVGYGITNAYTKTEVDDKLATKLNLTGGSLTGAISITAAATLATPTAQILCLNATSSTDSTIAMPGIGFHIPNRGYATLKYTKKFEFMNSSLTGHEQVKASKFITAGGTSTEVVCGDGALAPRVGTEIANTFTKDQLVSYSGKSTIIKNGGLGFLDPNTSSWAMAMSQYDTTGTDALTNIFGVKGGNNKVEYLYAGGSWDRAWLRIFPKGQLSTPFFKSNGEMFLSANYVRNLCSHTAEYNVDGLHNSLVIKTGIPVSNSRPYYLHVYGYNYGNGGDIDFTIGFYMYQSSPLNIYGVDKGTQVNAKYYIGKYTDPADNVEKVCVYWTADSPINNVQQHFIMVDGLFYGSITSTSTYTAEALTDEVKATLTQIIEASFLNRTAFLNKNQSFTGYITFAGGATFTGEATFNNSTTFNSSTTLKNVKNITIPGLESNNDYIENKSYDNGLWGTESGKSPEMTHGLASIKNAIKFNWYNDDWIIGNIRAGSSSSDGFGIGMEKTKSDGTIYQKNIFRLSPDGEIYLNGTPLANKYLSLSGGTLTGELKTKQITIEAGSWLVSNGSGISLQRADGTSYIWNTASKSIAIGTNSVGQSNELNASLVINGTNIYPGTSNKFSLGTDSYKFKDIYADGIVKGGRFLTGSKTKADLESNNNTGLSIVYAIPKNGEVAGDYGFSASNNANGIFAFRTHQGSGEDYMHYLGFSGRGLYYRSHSSTNNAWIKLNNPSMMTISNPINGEYSSTGLVIPELINGSITNVFHEPLKDYLKIERSQNGTTWIDTTDTDYSKCKQVMSYGNGGEHLQVAYDRATGKVGDRLRITINGAQAYCHLSHLYVYYSTMGATTKLTVEKNKHSAQDTWTTIIDKQTCTGWSGPNYYGLSESVMGQPTANGDSGYSYRITFEITAVSSGYNNAGSIINMWAFSTFSPYSVSTNHNNMFYYNVNRGKYVTSRTIEPLTNSTHSLGSPNYKWLEVYAGKFYGNLRGNADSADRAITATNDSSGNKIVDTYALASTCYGGPEGKFAIGNSDNLIGKALTGSWGIYNKYHDIVISEYDASTNTWVEKFNSTTLTQGSAKYNSFFKGEKGNFYASTRGSKVKMTVTSNAGSVYVQAIGLYLKTKDTTYNGNIDYSYWTNGGVIHYSDVNGTWGSWCNITMSGAYRTSFEIYFNEGGANAQITIGGFRIVTQTDGVVPVLIGKSHESYRADNADSATTATTATRADAIKGYFNPFNATNDTPAKWIELGTVAAACNTNTLSTAPSAYGVLFNGAYKTSGGGEIGQIWVGQAGAPVYRRVGNAKGWWSPGGGASAWIEMIDTLNLSNHVVPKTGGTFTGNVTAPTFKGNLDWSYIQNKPTSLPANGGNADTLKWTAFNKASDIGFGQHQWFANGAVSDISSMGYSTVFQAGLNMSRAWQMWVSRTDHATHTRHTDGTNWTEEYTLLDDHNYTNYVVPKTGGTFTGNVTFNGDLNVAAGKSIYLNRTDWNYICVPTGDYSGVAISQGNVGGDSTWYVMNKDAIYPNTGTRDLGKESKMWNHVYTNSIGKHPNIGIDFSIAGFILPGSSTMGLGADDRRWGAGYFSDAVYAAGGFYESSDERLKTFGSSIDVDFKELAKIRKSHFVFNDKLEQNQIGISAQEIQKLYPEVVTETASGYLNVDYAKLSVIALAAIDKLNERIEYLESKLK